MLIVDVSASPEAFVNLLIYRSTYEYIQRHT